MKKIVLFFAGTVFFLSACNLGNVTPLTTSEAVNTKASAVLSTQSNCVPPVVVSGFYIGETAPTPVPESDTLPVGWEEVVKVPETYKGKQTYIKLMRPRNGYDELWIAVHTAAELTNTSDVYLIYRTDKKEWREAPQTPGFSLFLDKNKSVWATVSPQSDRDPRLYRLDENADQFTPVVDKSNELGKGHIISSSIKVGKDGLFWFIFRNVEDGTGTREALYSFDPATLEAKTYSIGENFDSLEIDQNNNLYLMQNGETLVKFDPATGVSQSVLVPPYQKDEGFGATSLYIDHKGRLWVSDRARYDDAVSNPSIGDPFILIPSQIFIEYVSSLPGYRWLRPTVMLESIDGRLWYNGDVWFDPDTGEWCRFTTHPSSIVEDSEHNLWMIVSDRLYKLALGK